MTRQPPKRLKIAYLCDQEPRNPHFYSGGNARIYQALQAHVGDVTVLSTDWHWLEPLRRLIERLPLKILMRLRWRLHLALGGLINRKRARELVAENYDLLFCAYSYHALYKLKIPPNVLSAYTSDAIPTLYKQSEIGQQFGSFLSVSRLLDPWISRTEQRVFAKTDLLLWPSTWVAQAVAPEIAKGRNSVIPWGANIADPGPEQTPPQLAKDTPVNLLLVGRNWFAKGGPVAFEVMQLLRQQGYDARLTVIGCIPPDFHQNEFVTVHANLDKSIPEALQVFTRALRNAHFMVMPTFESYGFAMCEASAYGLPVLCWRIGGVPICDGVNGFALDKSAGPAEFCDVITAHIGAPAKYQSLRKTAYDEYRQHLNWDAWGQEVAQTIAERLKKLA